jgi:micrococcal nuclease
VRLIGIDAPEISHDGLPAEPLGDEAADFTRNFVRNGAVRLQFDRERLDRYERFLAYVWVDDRLLNEELLRAGLARARLGFNYSQTMKRRFRKAQDQARLARKGLWAAAADGKTFDR